MSKCVICGANLALVGNVHRCMSRRAVEPVNKVRAPREQSPPDLVHAHEQSPADLVHAPADLVHGREQSPGPCVNKIRRGVNKVRREQVKPVRGRPVAKGDLNERVEAAIAKAEEMAERPLTADEKRKVYRRMWAKDKRAEDTANARKQTIEQLRKAREIVSASSRKTEVAP